MDEVIVSRADLLSEDAQRLIESLNDELRRRYPEEGATHFRLDPEEVAEGRGAFVIARRAGIPVGCGGIRVLEPGAAELKRMFTRPEDRGRGVALAVLAALEGVARELRVERLVLETGVRQQEAIALYERSGFVPIASFGEYVSSPLSLCMAKDLAGRGPGSGGTHRIRTGV